MPKVEGHKFVASSNTLPLNIPIDALGTPGARMRLHVVPQFADSPKSDAAVLRDATPRTFIVSGCLSKVPSTAGRTGNIQGNFSANDGESYLMMPRGVDELSVATSRGGFKFKKNNAGEVSVAELECRANGPAAAWTSFIEIIYPVLDHMSYLYQVALFVKTIRILDINHQINHLDFIVPFRSDIVKDSTSVLFEEMRPVYAMYREGKNSESDFYRFLCFYKIIEGLIGKLRGNVTSRAKSAGVKLHAERELVPDDDGLSAETKKYVGKSIKPFFDLVLTKRFRKAVAHFQTDSGVLHVSSPAEIAAYADLALITDLCARRLIVSHERLLEQLGANRVQPALKPG